MSTSKKSDLEGSALFCLFVLPIVREDGGACYPALKSPIWDRQKQKIGLLNNREQMDFNEMLDFPS